VPDLFEQVMAEAALFAAWREVQVNDLEDGKVNEQVAAYSRDLFANLASLRASLQSGTYRPDPVYAMEIPKPSGGKRLVPSLRSLTGSWSVRSWRSASSSVPSRTTPGHPESWG
jgi:hypothetical protein